ncbi:MAG: hypothetical protein ACOC31_02320 [Bacteroidota bacterium]
MYISSRKDAFLKLGQTINNLLNHYTLNEPLPDYLENYYHRFVELVINAPNTNPWFNEESVIQVLKVIVNDLKEENIDNCLAYLKNKKDTKIIVAAILSGNKPVYGFLEMFAVLLSGNCFHGKLTANDNHLLIFLAELLMDIEPEFKNRIVFVEDQLKKFQGVIANDYKVSPEYLYKYFNKYPHIIHRRKYSAAVITGSEDLETLENIGKDIFMYFGRTVYNISKLYIPANYDIARFFKALEKYRYVSDYSKYANQYEYYKSVYLLNKVNHFDNGFLILRNSTDLAAPVGVVNYEFYDSKQEALNKLENNFHKLESIVGQDFNHALRIDPGTASTKCMCKKTRFLSTINFLTHLEKIV